MLQILLVIAPLFLIILASAVFQRTQKISENWITVLNEYALRIGLPALIFSALSKTSFSLSAQLDILAANSLFILGSFLMALLVGMLFGLRSNTLKTLFICLGFGNIAYLGIPVLTEVYGNQVTPTVSLIVAIYLFWMFSVGIGFLDYHNQKKRKNLLKTVILRLVKSPLIISVVLGLIVSAVGLKLPETLIKSLDMITASVTPTVLIVIGLFIGKSQFGKIKDWFPVLGFSLLTLLVTPALFYFSLKLLNFTPSSFNLSIIEAAMPLAITPFALADQYNLEKAFIARSIVLSTLLSVLTIPFWISML